MTFIIPTPVRCTDVLYETPLKSPTTSVKTPETYKGDALSASLSDGNYVQMLRAFDRLSWEEDSTSQIPQIVVVGDENVGKSSTIKRITNLNLFPTGEGLTTRMVTKLMLRHTNSKTEVILRIVDRITKEIVVDEQSLTYECSVVEGPDIQDFIRGQVSTYIQKFTAGSAPTRAQDVDTDHIFQIEIRSPDVTSLDLVDMPGLVMDPHEIQRKTQSLTRELIHHPNVVMICVLSMKDASLRNSSVLQEIRAVEQSNKSALGVLTHVDYSTPDKVERVKETFLPCSPLSLLIPMINGDETLKTKYTESEFKGAGVSALVKHLDKHLCEKMVKHWLPEKMTNLDQHEEYTRNEIAKLGVVADTDDVREEIAAEVQRAIVRFVQPALEKVVVDTAKIMEIKDPGMPAFTEKPQLRMNRIKFLAYWKLRVRRELYSLSGAVISEALRDLSTADLSMPLKWVCEAKFVTSRFSGMPLYITDLLSDRLQKMRCDEATVLTALNGLIEKYATVKDYTEEQFHASMTDIIREHYLIPVLLWCESEKFVSNLVAFGNAWEDDHDAKRKELNDELANISEFREVMEKCKGSVQA